MEPTEILSGSSIAAVNNLADRRVYSQDTNFGIRESIFTNGTWSGGDDESIIGIAKQNSPIAACNGKGLDQIRVYFLNQNSELQERWWSIDKAQNGLRDAKPAQPNNPWYDGPIDDQKIQVAAYSNIAAFVIDDSVTPIAVNLYVQGQDNVIQEYQYNGKQNWFPNKTFGTALAGTKIAAAVTKDGNGTHVRVYYQDVNNHIIENFYDPRSGWGIGQYASTGEAPFCGLACLTVLDPPSTYRVYYENQASQITEMIWDGNSWSKGQTFGPVIQGSNCAAINWTGPQLRLYAQNGLDGTSLTEYKNSGGVWVSGATVPPLHGPVTKTPTTRQLDKSQLMATPTQDKTSNQEDRILQSIRAAAMSYNVPYSTWTTTQQAYSGHLEYTESIYGLVRGSHGNWHTYP
ncbi:hypothetical protein V502_01676 [Pseudogymnoascus sp. VKM F-4520 (FW-2644)]|nr:hypothetical protein V502_01676 [Pseudogymnoascus sp. VKM F-4520 (FW-2644)]